MGFHGKPLPVYGVLASKYFSRRPVEVNIVNEVVDVAVQHTTLHPDVWRLVGECDLDCNTKGQKLTESETHNGHSRSSETHHSIPKTCSYLMLLVVPNLALGIMSDSPRSPQTLWSRREGRRPKLIHGILCNKGLPLVIPLCPLR